MKVKKVPAVVRILSLDHLLPHLGVVLLDAAAAIDLALERGGEAPEESPDDEPEDEPEDKQHKIWIDKVKAARSSFEIPTPPVVAGILGSAGRMLTQACMDAAKLRANEAEQDMQIMKRNGLHLYCSLKDHARLF